MESYSPIEDYAIIGNCRTAALVSKDGSVDWLCVPRFDGGAIFASLLDAEKGGRFRIRPCGPYSVTRRYAGHTAILETTFSGPDGKIRLTDLMPVASEEEKEAMLWPEHHLVRRIECLEGEIEVEVDCDPRPGFGRAHPRISDRGPLGIWFEHGGHLAILQSEIPLERVQKGDGLQGRIRLRAGDRTSVQFLFSHGEPGIIPPPESEGEFVRLSRRWWEGWVSQCNYDGPFRDTVIRSALTLKLLTFAPSGAVIAAATTSLPEALGGKRNWDYRFCWLRDSSWTLRALFDLGFEEEAEAFLKWLLHTTRLTRPRLQPMYDLFGETRLREGTLNHLEGYRGNGPVRIGNSARKQFQLDIYGELIAAAFEFVERGGGIESGEDKMLANFGRLICRRWREADYGLWEAPGKPRHYTYSKAMCWIGLDRLVRLARKGELRIPTEEFEEEARRIRKEVEARGYRDDLGSYVAVFEGEDVDASLIQLALAGYADPAEPKISSTVKRIRECLSENGLLRRYPTEMDKFPSREGAFGICNFWVVNYLARRGETEEAKREFERLMGYGNELGLFSEEIDPQTGSMLGNFPQAFTHVGLINAALALGAAEKNGG